MRWAILAGEEFLPLEVAKMMREEEIEPVVICLGKNAAQFEEQGFTVHRGKPGFLGPILRFLLEHRVDHMVMAGKVNKDTLLAGTADQEMMGLFAKLEKRNDDALQLAIVQYFEEHGIKIEKQTRFLQHLIPESGLLAGPALNAEEDGDVKLGYQMAKEIGRLDIGQTVVVKKGMILAVEAVEHTDQAILRGGQYGGPGIVVVKVAKPQQDFRFDVPTVGLTTLQALLKVKARILGVEAGATFILEREKLLAEAEKHGISVVALDDLAIKDN